MAAVISYYESSSTSTSTSTTLASSDVAGDRFFSYNLNSLLGSLAMVTLCLLGFYGNTVSVFVFSQPPMRSSINVLLTGLSLIDSAVLLSSIPVFVLPTMDQYLKFKYIETCYKFALLFVYPLAMMVRTSSVWTFVLISFERYFAVCYPLEVHKTMTVRGAKRAQLCVIGASVAYNVIRFCEYRSNDGSSGRGADQVKPWLRDDENYFLIYYTALNLLINYLAPFVIIVVLHIFILSSIKTAYDERRRLYGRQRVQYRTSRMIVVVTVMFGLCNVLALAVSAWEGFEPHLFEGPRAVEAYLLLDMSNVAILVNSSTTFLLFLIYCQRYRKMFALYVKCACFSSPSQEELLGELTNRQHNYYRLTTRKKTATESEAVAMVDNNNCAMAANEADNVTAKFDDDDDIETKIVPTHPTFVFRDSILIT